MSQYRVPLQIVYNREAADGAGMVPPDALGSSTLTGTVNATGAEFRLAFNIPRDSTIVAAQLFFAGGFTGTLVSAAGRTTWSVSGTGVAATNATLANGAAVFDDDSRNLVLVGGAAATLVAAAATTVQAFAYYKRGPNGGVGVAGVPTQGSAQPQWSSALVGAFADDALGDVPPTGDLRGMFAREELRLTAAGGGGSSVVQPGGTIPLRMCDASYTDPWGRVLLTGSDVGTGVGQISPLRSSWLASQFDAHPQCFVRLTSKVRGLATAQTFTFTDTTPINSSPAVMRLYTVVRAPTHSTWLVVIDGVPQTLTFAHPAGSDLRRPADIWNAVLVPAMLTRSNTGGPGTPAGTAAGVSEAVTWEVQPGAGIFPVIAPSYPTVTFRLRGGLPRRLGFLSYARCLDVWDEAASPYDDPIYTEVSTS